VKEAVDDLIAGGAELVGRCGTLALVKPAAGREAGEGGAEPVGAVQAKGELPAAVPGDDGEAFGVTGAVGTTNKAGVGG
jgi:hypothetical protein